MQRCYRRTARVAWRRASLQLAVLVLTLSGGVTSVAEPIRRVRGIIDQDQTWSGHVMITDDVTVLGATLTVQAGAIVEFAAAPPRSNPVLTIGEAQGRPAMLRLDATPESPIVIRTLPDTNAGRIVAWLRPPPGAGSAKPNIGNDPAVTPATTIRWQHVRFEDLGYELKLDASFQPSGSDFEPAVAIHLGPGASLHLSNCEFTRSSRLLLELDAGTSATLSSNRMSQPTERTALHLRSQAAAEPPSVDVAKNRADAAIIADGLAGLIRENVLIGPHAALVLGGSGKGDLAVRGNYVHNTSRQDDGRYCFTSEDPGAFVERNIFRGGSTCVRMGTVRMLGNVLIGAPTLRSARTTHSQTNQLVAALPPGALFADNLLLGPAYSMVVPGTMPGRGSMSSARSTTILRNNVFDGLDAVSRGVHVGPIDRAPASLRVENNLFVRVGATVFEEPGGSASQVSADHNACAPWSADNMGPVKGSRTPGPDGVPAGSTNVLRERIEDLHLAGSLPARIADLDAAILEGTETVEHLRRKFRDGYRPLEGSPLIGAGIPSRDARRRADIGLSEREPASSQPEPTSP